MANIGTLEVYYDRKVQLQQFEPVTYGATATVSLDDGDDPAEVYSEVKWDLMVCGISSDINNNSAI